MGNLEEDTWALVLAMPQHHVTLGFCLPFSQWESCTRWLLGPLFLR